MIVLSDVQKLYDGVSSEETSVHAHVDLFIDGDRIHDVRPHDPELDLSDAHTRVDASGFVVTPGLIDCHGHITALGVNPEQMDRMNGSAGMVWAEKILHVTLVEGGVTTLRDVGGATHLLKRLVDEGVLIGPRLKIAICMLSSTGGHADFRGPDRCHAEISRLWPAAPGRPSSLVDGPWECRKRVREIAACGADLIKLCTSPGVASPRDDLEHREFTAEEVAAICDEAAGRGLKVAAHAHSRSGIELAIENGVHDLQHISFLDQRLVELAHERGCTVTPTSWIMAEVMAADDLDPRVMDKAKRVGEVHTAAVQYAASGGLRILAGSDPVMPGMHGRNYMELVHLVRDGLRPLAAWHGATGLAAGEIGQSDTGTLEAGQRADVLVFSEDVLEQPARLEHGCLAEVIKDGVAYRGGLPELPQRTYADAAAGLLGLSCADEK